MTDKIKSGTHVTDNQGNYIGKTSGSPWEGARGPGDTRGPHYLIKGTHGGISSRDASEIRPVSDKK